MYLDAFSQKQPEKPAIIIGKTGEFRTYKELVEASRKIGRFLRSHDIRPGDRIVALVDDPFQTFEIAWAAQRIGGIYTFISTGWELAAQLEIINEIEPVALFMTSEFAGQLAESDERYDAHRVNVITSSSSGPSAYERIKTSVSGDPLSDEVEGQWMFFSSGTTGRPKGVQLTRPPAAFGKRNLSNNGKFDESTVYLGSSPLHYGGGLRPPMLVLGNGGTVVCGQECPALALLDIIDRFEVTVASFRGDFFVDLYKEHRDLLKSRTFPSLRKITHGGSPVSTSVKTGLIDILGNIVEESYACTEAAGEISHIGSAEWLARPGSVGKPINKRVHILDENQNELDAGKIGYIYFEDPIFTYFKKPAATAAAYSKQGWGTSGDVGYLDEDGYLYLSDRSANVIELGSARIYPKEVEDMLSSHPAVRDVAVVAINLDGFDVLAAALSITSGFKGTSFDTKDLKEHCASRLGLEKTPEIIRIFDEIPRSKSGKLIRPAVHALLTSKE